jgi:hypothetical protein
MEAMLARLDYPFEPTPVPELDWAFAVKTGPIRLVVGPPKGKSFLVVVAPVTVGEKHQGILRTMSAKDRQTALERVILALLASDVEYNMKPDRAPIPAGMQITARYLEATVEAASFDATLRKVRDAALKVILLLQSTAKGTGPNVAVIETAQLPSGAAFDDWAANLLPVSSAAAKRIFEMAAERGVDAAAIVDDLIAAAGDAIE